MAEQKTAPRKANLDTLSKQMGEREEELLLRVRHERKTETEAAQKAVWDGDLALFEAIRGSVGQWFRMMSYFESALETSRLKREMRALETKRSKAAKEPAAPTPAAPQRPTQGLNLEPRGD